MSCYLYFCIVIVAFLEDSKSSYQQQKVIDPSPNAVAAQRTNPRVLESVVVGGLSDVHHRRTRHGEGDTQPLDTGTQKTHDRTQETQERAQDTQRRTQDTQEMTKLLL